MLDIGASSDEEVRELGIEIGTIVPNTELTSYLNIDIVLKHGIIDMVVSIEILELLSDVELDVDLYVGANVQEDYVVLSQLLN